MIELPPHDLYPHPREASIYGDNQDASDLAAKIKESGWIAPLVVSLRTGRHIIISGHRRWLAALALQLPLVPVEVQEFATEEEELEALLLHNLYRDKTTEQKGREALAWGEIERSRAKARQGKRTDLLNVPSNLEERSSGEALEKMAERVGMKKTNLDKTLKVVEQADALKAQGGERAAETWLGVLNGQSVDAAYSLLKESEEARGKILNRVATGGALNVKDAIRKTRLDEQVAAIEAFPSPKGKFRVIVADPPWRYTKRAEDVTHRGACPYPTMDTSSICAMPVEALAHDDCILWLWTTNAFMEAAHQVARAWGFEVKTILTWAKSGMGVGDWLRGQTEHCLMAIRGKPVVVLTNQTTLLNGPLREHSRKPEEFYALVDALCPGNKCELFARETRPGWESFGAEIGVFDE